MSFPRILPDSSNSPGVILNSFQAWRNNGSHQSHVFSKITFKFFSLLAQPLRFSFSRSISVILVVFLVVIWRPKKNFSSKSCPFSRSFVVLASCYQSRIIPFVRYSFSYPSGVCQKLFSRFFSPEAIIPAIVLYLSRFFVQVFFISSLSLCSFASKSPLAFWFF